MKQIICYSQFSDVVGVDIYWVPSTLASIANPYSPRDIVDYISGTKVWIDWFRDKVPDHQYLFVTQVLFCQSILTVKGICFRKTRSSRCWNR